MKPNNDNSNDAEDNIDTKKTTDIKVPAEDLNGNMFKKMSVTVVVSRMKGNNVNKNFYRILLLP